MRIPAAVLGALLALAAAPAAPRAGGGQPLKLERLVLVERHGVRSPTKAPEALARYAAEPWPQWPVEPGILTDHGAEGVRLMGAWLRADYARRGLWPARGCLKPGAVHVYADGKDQRTRVSGQRLLDGAFPGCGLKDDFGPEGEEDALFSAISAGACPIDPEEARKAVLAQAGGDLDRPDPRYRAARQALAAITNPGLPPTGKRNLLTASAEDGVKMDGPLADASTITENLFLEYVQGMPADQVGWGRAGSADAIARIMPLHDISADLMRRTPYLATHNGALLGRAVLAAVQGRPAVPRQGGEGTTLLAIAGHDTNLSNLAGVLGVDWTLEGQPDKTPPGAALVFEVWRAKAGGQRFVRVAFVYQTLEQLRQATPLDRAHPPGRVDLRTPGCADGPGGACRLETFERVVAARLPAECPAALAPRERVKEK